MKAELPGELQDSDHKIALVVSDEELRGRLLGRLLAEGLNVIVIPATRQHLPSAQTIAVADTVIISFDVLSYLWREDPEALELAHERRRFILLLENARLRDAMPLMNVVDGLVFSDINLENIRDIIDLAANGHCLFPAGILPVLLDDWVRIGAAESLSDLEYTVLQEIAVGRTNLDIADQLGLSESTVKTLVRNILSKLRLSNRTEAAVYAVRKRLLGRRRRVDGG